MNLIFNPHYYELNPFSISPIIVAVFCLTLSFVILTLNQREPFGRSFFYFSLFVGIWLIASSLVINSRDLNNALIWSHIMFAAMMIVPAALYHLSCSLTGNPKEQKKIIMLLYGQAGVFALLTLHKQFISGIFRTVYGVYPQAGPLFLVLIFFVLITFFIIMTNLVYYYFFKSTLEDRAKFRYILILFVVMQLAFVDLYASYDARIFPSGFLVIFVFSMMIAVSKLRNYFEVANACAVIYEQKIVEKEQKIQDLTRRLKLVEDKLMESGKISSVAHLSAGILHQISQPITAINGFVKFLKKEMDHQTTFYRPVCLIDEQCTYLKLMLEDMMELVKHREIKRQNMNVHDAIYKAMNLLKDELRIRRINWDLDLEENVPKVCADSIQLQQIFMNIVVNSMQALGELARDKEKYIRISTKYLRDRKEIRISFQDTGPGISKIDEERVFEPFYTTKSKGVGIGLALCQSLIQEQGGTITIDQTVLNGAHFVIHLPVVE